MTYQHFVGIDVAKDTLEVRCSATEAGLEVANTEAGHAHLIQWLKSHKADPATTVVVMENTGLYHQHLAEHLLLAGFTVSVEKTTILKKVAPEHHRKDDAFDAALLLEYAQRFSDRLTMAEVPSAYHAQNPDIEQIRLLYTAVYRRKERRRLVTQRSSVLQLQGSAEFRITPTDFVEHLWQAQRTLFDEQIKTLEARIMQIIKGNADLQHRFDQLSSIAGIGEKTAWCAEGTSASARTLLRPRQAQPASDCLSLWFCSAWPAQWA